MKSELDRVFELGRPITEYSKMPYLYLAYKYNLTNYRLISSGELLIKGKDIPIPHYVKVFLQHHQEALMIANMINGVVTSLVFRSVNTHKEFAKWGNTKALCYGLGDLDENFKYGDLLVLVEGHLDRDVMSKTIYKNTLGVMTSVISKNQEEWLRGLTNNFILFLDNDEAGSYGNYKTKQMLEGCNVFVMKHYQGLKDAGDMVKLMINDVEGDLPFIQQHYRNEIEIHGGKI